MKTTGNILPRRIAPLLRAFVAVGLFALLFFLVDLSELTIALLRLNAFSVSVLLAISVLMIWASCLKWQIFLNSFGHHVPVLHLMKLYTIGYFFNTFFPSYIGGDVARSYHLGRYLKNQKDAAVSTFLERFTGLVAMSFLGLTFVLLGEETTQGVELAIYMVAAGAALLTLICFSHHFRRRLRMVIKSVFAVLGVSVFERFCERWFDKLDSLLGDGALLSRLFLKAMALSFLFHLLTVVNTYAAGWAIGWESPNFGGLFVVVPLILLVSMIPITPSGLGLTEGAFVFFLQRVGATEVEGLGVALVLRAKVVIIAAVGGLLWLGVKNLKRTAHASESVQ